MSRTGALGEGSSRPTLDSNEIETASGENTRAAPSPGEPEAVASAESVGPPGKESLADLVHRLRTPLNAALLWVRLVRRGGLEPHSVQRALETIEQNLCDQNRLLGELVGEAQSGDTVGGAQPRCGPSAR